METENETWKKFGIGLSAVCLLVIIATSFVIIDNESLKNQLKECQTNCTANYEEGIAEMMYHIVDLQKCYWEENELTRRLSRCGLNSTSVIGGGCGKLVYEMDEKDALIYCNIEDYNMSCVQGEVTWIEEYCWEENECFYWHNFTEYCPPEEGAVAIRSGYSAK